MDLGDTGNLLKNEHARVLVDNDRVAAVRRKLDARSRVGEVLARVKDNSRTSALPLATGTDSVCCIRTIICTVTKHIHTIV